MNSQIARQIKRLGLFFVFLILPLSMTIHAAQAADPPKTHAQLVLEYIELSGSKALVESFPDQIQQMLAQKQAMSSDQGKEEFKEVSELFKGVFDEKKMLAEISAYILKTTDRGSVEKFLEWLKRPLAKKVMAEKNDMAKNNLANVQAFMEELKKNPLAPERLALIQDLEKATQETEFALSISLEVLTGTISALNNAMPPEKKMPKAQIEAQIESIESMLRGSLKEQVTTALSYSYRNITDKELKEYTAFYKTDIGKKENQAKGKGFAQAIKTSFSNLQEKIVAYMIKKSSAFEKDASAENEKDALAGNKKDASAEKTPKK